MKKALGFTLIELLVVIGILGLLMVYMLKNVGGANISAKVFANEQNLSWWYEQIENYKVRHKVYPKGGGSELFRTMWMSNIFGKNEDNLQRFFSPFDTDDADGTYQTMKNDNMDFKGLWRDTISAEEVGYAARAKKHKRTWAREDEAWISDDNSDGEMWNLAYSMTILFAGGKTKSYYLAKEMVEKDWVTQEEADDVISGESDFVIQIGSQSRVPFLRKLDY